MRSRLDVNQEMRKAVVVEQTHEPLDLRDMGRINARTYLALLLDLDRERRPQRA